MKRTLIQVKEILQTLIDEAATPEGSLAVWLDSDTVMISTDEVLQALAMDYYTWDFIYLDYPATNTPVAWFRKMWANYINNNMENFRKMWYDLNNPDNIEGYYEKHKSENKDITDEMDNGKTTTTTYTNLSNEREYGSSNTTYKQTNKITTDLDTTPRDQSAATIEGNYKDTQNGEVKAVNSGKDTRTIKADSSKNYIEEYGYSNDSNSIIKMFELRKKEDVALFIMQDFAKKNLILLPERRCDNGLYSDIVY